MASIGEPESVRRGRRGTETLFAIPARRWTHWDIYDDKLAEYVKQRRSRLRLRRHLPGAERTHPLPPKALQEALKKNPKNDLARAALVDIYFSQQAYDKVIQLYSQPAVTPATEDQTIISSSDSFDKTGNTKKAADIVESAIVLKPQSGPLYLALASYYTRLEMHKG